MDEPVNRPDNEVEKPESMPDIPESPIESITPERTVPEGMEMVGSEEQPVPPEETHAVSPYDEPNAVLEGEFEEVPPEELAAQHAAATAAQKSPMKPAIFVILTILVLIVLCCLMSIIIFFMVRPAMLESRTLGMALIPIVKELL